MEHYLAVKNRKILSFEITWMKLGSIMLSEIRERKIPHGITYIWNFLKSQELIETESKKVIARGWRVVEIIRGWESIQMFRKRNPQQFL